MEKLYLNYKQACFLHFRHALLYMFKSEEVIILNEIYFKQHKIGYFI